MKSKKLNGKRVAALLENGFEQREFNKAVKALKSAGASVYIISKSKKVKGWNNNGWGDKIKTDIFLDKAVSFEYDALLLPQGIRHIDKIRVDHDAIQFVKSFMEKGKLIAAISRASSILIETGMLKGKKITSPSSIKTDMQNANAWWIDKKVVAYEGLVTSRDICNMGKFNKKMVAEFLNSIHGFGKSKPKGTNLSDIYFTINSEYYFDENHDKIDWGKSHDKVETLDDM